MGMKQRPPKPKTIPYEDDPSDNDSYEAEAEAPLESPGYEDDTGRWTGDDDATSDEQPPDQETYKRGASEALAAFREAQRDLKEAALVALEDLETATRDAHAAVASCASSSDLDDTDVSHAAAEVVAAVSSLQAVLRVIEEVDDCLEEVDLHLGFDLTEIRRRHQRRRQRRRW